MTEDRCTGFKYEITENSIIIEMPFENLINGFNLNPENYSGDTILEGKEKEFAKWLIENMFDEANQHTGDNHIVEMLDKVYELAYEDYLDFVNYPDEDED